MPTCRLCCTPLQGFLASRSVADSVCAAVALMAPSQVGQCCTAAASGRGVVSRSQQSFGRCNSCKLSRTGPLPPPLPPQLPCFGYGKPLDSLRARFRPELTPSQAAAYMKGLILGAYDKWTTG